MSSTLRVSFSNLPIRRKGLAVIAIPVLALLVSLLLTSYAQWKANAAGGSIEHTLGVEKEIYNAILTVLQVQSAARDHATNADRDAAQYQQARQKLAEQLQVLESHTADNPHPTSRVRRCRALVTAAGPVNKNSLLMNAIDQGLRAMLVEEERLLTLQTAARTRATLTLTITIALSLALGVFAALAAVSLFTSGISRPLIALALNADRLERGQPLLPLPHGTGEFGRLCVALQNACATLRETGERLKLALKTGRITMWESNASGELRYEGKDEFIESTSYPADLLPSTLGALFDLVEPSQRAMIQQEFASAMASNVEFRKEYEVVSADHSVRSVSLNARQYSRGRDDAVILGVMMDTTERRRSEQQAKQLAKSEQHLREQTRVLTCVLDSMGDGVVVADSTGKFLLFNPAAEKHLGIGALEGVPSQWTRQYGIFCADQVTPYPAADLPLAKAIRGLSVDGEDLFVRNPSLTNGAWITTTARPLKNEDGTIWGGVVVISDITGRKRVDQALSAAKDDAENASRAKNEFLSRMSHELRTPLNSILGFSQILKMHDLPQRPQECVQHIIRAGTHLLALIDEVLDIARIEAGKLSLSLEPMLISDSIHQVLDMVRPLAASRQIDLVVNCPRDARQHIRADRQRLHQVLLNLLSNAIKYNRDEGRVEISCCETNAGQLRINVRDTGPGISEIDQVRLFTPFERLGANQSEIQGTGLGLALSKCLVEAMDGKIGVTSLLGTGSTFWIEFPCSEAPEESLQRNELLSVMGLKRFEETRSVLYIEDNVSNTRLMEHIAGYRPHIRLVPAIQGRMGLELAREHQPDLILLDLHLPDLSGDQVFNILHADPKTSGIPVIVISADATPGQVNRLLSAGVTAYMTKPVDVEKLLKLLDEHLVDGGGPRDRSLLAGG